MEKVENLDKLETRPFTDYHFKSFRYWRTRAKNNIHFTNTLSYRLNFLFIKAKNFNNVAEKKDEVSSYQNTISNIFSHVDFVHQSDCFHEIVRIWNLWLGIRKNLIDGSFNYRQGKYFRNQIPLIKIGLLDGLLFFKACDLDVRLKSRTYVQGGQSMVLSPGARSMPRHHAQRKPSSLYFMS